MENHVCLRWASHQDTVLSGFEALLATETLVDVTLAADGQYLRAHKILLSVCSPYFKELLSLDPNKDPIIFMKDVKYSELKALVQFMYSGEVNIAQDDLPSFLAVAQSLKIRCLVSTDPSASNTRADTLIVSDFNLPSSFSASRPTVPGPPSSAGINAMSSCTFERHEPPRVLIQGYYQHQPAPYTPTTPAHGNQAQTQAQSSIPNISDLRSTGPIVPTPPKRLRVQQHQRDRDSLEFNPMNVIMSAPTVQSHRMPSSQVQVFDRLLTETLDTSHLAAHDPDQDQGHLNDNPMDQHQTEMIQMGEVKVGIGNHEIHAMAGVYDEANAEEEPRNSISHSSYSESWKHDDSKNPDFQDNSMLDQEQDDNGEIPGTAGTGNEAGTSGQAAGRQGEAEVHRCDMCGRQWRASSKLDIDKNRRHFRRHCNFLCPLVLPKFQCSHCQKTFRLKENLTKHFKNCSIRHQNQ